MSNHTSLIFILDRSGSMMPLTEDTIGGYNSVIAQNKTADGTADVTLILFDDQYEKVYDHVDIKEVTDLDDKTYFARGMTSLLDAVGKAVSEEKAYQKALPKDKRPDKTIVTIITDGQENNSREFTYDSVSKLLKKVQNKKHNPWVVTFLGANIDAAKEATHLGINAKRAQNYVADHKGTNVTYSAVASMSANLRSASVASFADESTTDAAILDAYSVVNDDYEARND